jgi:hypothetical protein
MKNRIFFSLIFALIFSVFMACGKKDETKTSDNKDTKTDSKKDDGVSFDSPVMVDFKITGKMNGTVNAIYFKTKARTYSTMEMGSQKISSTVYYDGSDYVYMITEVGGIKSGMKMKKGEFGKKEGEIDALSFKDRIKEMDKIGTEEIIGKTCDIYKSKDGRVLISVYKEMVPLKFSVGDGKMVMEATKIEKDVKVDDNTFTPPADVKYMDAGDMMKDMKDPTDKTKNLEEKKKEMEDLMKKYKK